MVTILITGASSGLGAALADHYANKSCCLALVGRDQQRLEQVAQRCKDKGAQVEIGLIDVTDTTALASWIQQIDQQSPIDMIIANAGITSQIGEQGQGESWQQIQQVFAINLQGVLNTIHPILERMRSRKVGQIVLVSSLAAYRGMPVTPAYSASKAAVKNYGEALRGWLAADGVKVNVVCPGFVKSAMSDRFPGAKPFLLSAEKAAAIIAKGLARNQAIISFPFPLHVGMWLLTVMPFPLASFFMGLFGYNQARKPKQ